MKKILLLCFAWVALCPLVNAQNPCSGLPVVTVTVSDNTPCEGEQITLTASGATTYSWNNNVNNGVAFTPSSSDTFVVISTDVQGCMDTSEVIVEVLEVPNIIASASSINTCLGESVLLEASNGVSYTWITPSIPNGTQYTPTELGANIYTVEGEGANGCTNTSQVVVVVKDLPALPTVNLDRITTCVNAGYDEQIVATASEGRVFWYTDEALTEEYRSEPDLIAPNDVVGQQEYYAAAFLGGCYSEGVRVETEVFSRPDAVAGEDFSITAGDRGSLDGSSLLASSVEWTPGMYLTDANALNPEFTARNTTVFTLTATNSDGCTNSDDITVSVNNELTISNIMTPNGDGDNDVWKIYPETILSTCNVRLFDGFGRLLLESDAYGNDWDAIFEGDAVPDGDYYYHVDCPNFNKKGTLTIIN